MLPNPCSLSIDWLISWEWAGKLEHTSVWMLQSGWVMYLIGSFHPVKNTVAEFLSLSHDDLTLCAAAVLQRSSVSGQKPSALFWVLQHSFPIFSGPSPSPSIMAHLKFEPAPRLPPGRAACVCWPRSQLAQSGGGLQLLGHHCRRARGRGATETD